MQLTSTNLDALQVVDDLLHALIQEVVKRVYMGLGQVLQSAGDRLALGHGAQGHLSALKQLALVLNYMGILVLRPIYKREQRSNSLTSCMFSRAIA